ncbi:MAG: hypothetical protein FD159_907 [Syntrophaceae bacterium]|nr:MAG: hypothetical protein FD159_907 [Syntrophaceae bacterium]
MNEEKTRAIIMDAKGVITHLTFQGWRVSSTSIYRHIKEGRLRHNKEGVFEVHAVDLYAKRNLKRLNLPTNNKKAETNDHEAGLIDTENSFADIKGVGLYLASRGWLAPRITLYRHIKERKIKRNFADRFDIIAIEKYARKYLKCLDVINSSSDDMARLFQTAIEKFLRDRAAGIITFLSGDTSKAEELKTFLADESRKYFKLQYAQEQGATNE